MHINISPNVEVRDKHTRQIKTHASKNDNDRLRAATSREFNTVMVKVQ